MKKCIHGGVHIPGGFGAEYSVTYARRSRHEVFR